MGFLWLLIQNYHILFESEEVIGYWVCMCVCVCVRALCVKGILVMGSPVSLTSDQ